MMSKEVSLRNGGDTDSSSAAFPVKRVKVSKFGTLLGMLKEWRVTRDFIEGKEEDNP
jgi:hypothetical protein